MAALIAGLMRNTPDMQKKRSGQSTAEEARIARLDAFAQALIAKRKHAVDSRASSGIEQIWLEDEEFYDAIDDQNRAEVVRKPTTMDGRLTTVRSSKTARSNVFVSITQPYVDMASARVADMLLPTDDLPFSVDATPMPDIAEATKDMETVIDVGGAAAPAGEIAQKMVDEAKESSKKAEKRIWDWLVESQWHSEVRQVIEDAARIGTGVLKGPFPVKFKSKKMNRQPDGTVQIEIVEKTKPGCKRINPWDFYPDAACGQSIHNGSGTWEKDHISARQLRDLKGTLHNDGTPQYIDSQIDAVLAEGPLKRYEQKDHTKSDNDQFEIWHFYGTADHEDLKAAGCDCEEGKTLPVLVVMVNDRVIKATISTLDSGDFPYDVMVWQRRPGTWVGRGVARQIRTPQRMVNAATRNMLDNAGLSAGPQIFINQKVITPADGSWEVTPRKLWITNDDAEPEEIARAIHSIEIKSMQTELMNIIDYGMELAEKVTSMPLLMQGQQGQSTETVGGMTMLQNNASSVLRRIAKIFDDNITVPMINRYYEWLLLYGEDPKEKGDFLIVAKGSSALYERDAQNQALIQMAPFVKDPAFKIAPDKWFAEMARGQKVDPKRIQYTDEEWDEMQRKMAEEGSPVDPRIEAAKIKAEVDIERANIAAETSMNKAKLDTDRDTVYVQAQHERDQANAQAKMDELTIKRELAMLEYANREKVNLDQVKSQMAQTAMKLRVQKELAMTPPAGAPQVATPPTEPRGRAPKGQAYQK